MDKLRRGTIVQIKKEPKYTYIHGDMKQYLGTVGKVQRSDYLVVCIKDYWWSRRDVEILDIPEQTFPEPVLFDETLLQKENISQLPRVQDREACN